MRSKLDLLDKETVGAVRREAHPASRSSGLVVWSPPTDVLVTEDAVVVRMELAATSAEDVHVQATDRELIVSGIRRAPSGVVPRRVDRMEIAFGRFERRIALPAPVLADQARARLADGLLEIILPFAGSRIARALLCEIRL